MLPQKVKEWLSGQTMAEIKRLAFETHLDGKTQQQAADSLGVNQATVNRWVRSIQAPGIRLNRNTPLGCRIAQQLIRKNQLPGDPKDWICRRQNVVDPSGHKAYGFLLVHRYDPLQIYECTLQAWEAVTLDLEVVFEADRYFIREAVNE